MLPDVYTTDSPLAMQSLLIDLSALLRRLADKNLRVAQNRYRSEQDKEVRLKPTYGPGD